MARCVLLLLLVLVCLGHAADVPGSLQQTWNQVQADAQGGRWEGVQLGLPGLKELISQQSESLQQTAQLIKMHLADIEDVRHNIKVIEQKMKQEAELEMQKCKQPDEEARVFCKGVRLLASKDYGMGIHALFESLLLKETPQAARAQANILLPQAYNTAAHESADERIPALDVSHIDEAVSNGTVATEGGFLHHLYRPSCVAEQIVSHSTREMRDLSEEIGHWPELLPGQAAQTRYLHGSYDAQTAIWKHQQISVSRCEHPDTRYLVPRLGERFGVGAGYGIGALIHIVTSALALAMQLDRILVLDPADQNVFATDTSSQGGFKCASNGNLECFFMPISSCEYKHAVSPDQQLPMWNSLNSEQLRSHRTLQVVGNDFKDVPALFLDLIKPTIRAETAQHWWNAQAAVYIVRPNSVTRAEIAKRRAQNLAAPYDTKPLPPGTISTHVRHGDKGIEARVVRLADYVTAASKLHERSKALKMQLFVSTEDPSVIESSKQYTDTWEVVYAKVHRENLPTFGLAARSGGVDEMLNSLMNLQLAVECDAWVCTLSSNWCRMIDELRSVVAGKAAAAYVDVGFRCFQGCDL